MKYIAIIDADEKPVSCEFFGCNGNVRPYSLGATTDIKALKQEPVLDKIRAEIEQYQSDAFYSDDVMINKKVILGIIDKYRK